jgi:hypothetical protein
VVEGGAVWCLVWECLQGEGGGVVLGEGVSRIQHLILALSVYCLFIQWHRKMLLLRETSCQQKLLTQAFCKILRGTASSLLPTP